MISKKELGYLSDVVIFLSVLFFLVLSANYGLEESRVSHELNSKLSVLAKDPSLSDVFTFIEDKVYHIDALKQKQHKYHVNSQSFFVLFLALSLSFLLYYLFIKTSRRHCKLFLVYVALLSLIAGVSLPALSLNATKSFPLIGEVTLYYNSKGVFSSITSLMKVDGAFFVGMLIIVFSLILPLYKISIKLLTVFSTSEIVKSLNAFSHRVGRWAMADVYVVAVLLSFFAIKYDKMIEAKIQIGFHYFFVYATLIVAMDFLYREIDKYMDKNQPCEC